MKITMKERIIDVEIQLSNEGNFQNRALYYWSRLFSQSLESGENFNALPEAIVISFIDFNLFDCPQYHSSFHVSEDMRGEILTKKFAIHFFELPKIPKDINVNKKIELWLKLIGAETDEELYELEKSKDKEIKEALEYVKKLNSDEGLKRQVEMRRMALIEERSALNFAENKGIKKVFEAMKASGMSEDEIDKIVKLIK